MFQRQERVTNRDRYHAAVRERLGGVVAGTREKVARGRRERHRSHAGRRQRLGGRTRFAAQLASARGRRDCGKAKGTAAPCGGP
jgi:hypothetical protein